MATRIALLSDIHGNAVALEAVRKAIKKERPDHVIVAGDIVMNGPDPAGAIAGVRELEAAGALVVQGNTDIAVADADYAAAFPWLTEGVPDSFRYAAEWAHDEIGAEGLDWLRRLPAERRLRIDVAPTSVGGGAVDGEDAEGGSAADLEADYSEFDSAAVARPEARSRPMLVLGCHASPGSQTSGFDPGLDASVFLDRMSRTDARVICCGHTHVPDVREFGWRVIVNGGSCGWVFDGDPTASWALVTIDGDSVTAEIRRTEFDTLTVSNALSSRGLPGDVYRAATVRTGKLVR